MGTAAEAERSQQPKETTTNGQKYQPVRVVVSYPLEDEGKDTNYRWKWKRWCIVLTTLILVTTTGVLLYFYLKDEAIIHQKKGEDVTISNDDDIESYPAPHKYLISLVQQRYNEDINNAKNRTELYEHFKDQLSHLSHTELEVFFANLGPEFPLTMPDDEDKRLDIVGELTALLTGNLAWLSRMEDEEQKLMSYEYQRRLREGLDRNSNSEVPQEWTKYQKRALKSLRERYNKPMTINISNNLVEIYKPVVVLSQVFKQIPQNITQVTIVGSLVYLDADLRKSVALSIIAPKWQFLRNVEFDLSGSTSAKATLKSATIKSRETSTHGGLFLGIGNFDKSKLKVYTDGGNGTHIFNNTDYQKFSTVHVDLNETPCTMQNESYRAPKSQLYRVYLKNSCTNSGLAGLRGEAIFILNNTISIESGKDGIQGNGKENIPCYYRAWKTTQNIGGKEMIKWDVINKKICDVSEKTNVAAIMSEFNPSPFFNKKEVYQRAISFFSEKARFENDGNIFGLLKSLEENKIIFNFTTVGSLSNETSRLITKNASKETFESFLNKVKTVLNQTTDPQEIEALKFMRAAVWSKISSLSYGFGDYYIVKLEEYIDHAIRSTNTVNDQLGLVLKNTALRDQEEVSEKLSESQKNLKKFYILPLQKLFSDSTEDYFITRLSITVANASREIIKFTKQVISSETPILAELRETLDAFHDPDEVFLEAENFTDDNNTSCGDLKIPMMLCITKINPIEYWKSYLQMEGKIMGAFETLFPHTTGYLPKIENVFETVRIELKPELASNYKIREKVNGLRDLCKDLSLLIHRALHIENDLTLQENLNIINSGSVLSDLTIINMVNDLKLLITTNELRIQYNKIYSAYKQWAYPAEINEVTVSPDAGKDELQLGIKAIKDAIVSYKTTIQDRDANIVEAEFSDKGSIGAFYTWPHKEVQIMLTELFQGKEVLLHANIHKSVHVPRKEAIKFQTIALKLTGKVENILNNFALIMIHSGYSQYYYRRKIYTDIQPQVQLFYSFSHEKEDLPIAQNNVYKKLKEGDIRLSPYTTWTVQLHQLKNVPFQELQQFVNTTQMHLVGHGWYTMDGALKTRRMGHLALDPTDFDF